MALKLYEEGLKLFNKKDFKKALAKFEKALEKAEFPELASRCKTFIVICREKIEEAKSKKDFENNYATAVFLLNNGNFSDAIKVLNLLEKEGKIDKESYNFLSAIAEAGMENLKKAEQYLKKAIKLNSSNKIAALKEPLLKPIVENMKGI